MHKKINKLPRNIRELPVKYFCVAQSAGTIKYWGVNFRTHNITSENWFFKLICAPLPTLNGLKSSTGAWPRAGLYILHVFLFLVLGHTLILSPTIHDNIGLHLKPLTMVDAIGGIYNV